MTESFVMYRSFCDAIKHLSDVQYGQIMRAINDYALDDIVPVLEDPALNMAFVLIKPQIDANNKRRANGIYGRMGGRPKQPRDNNPMGYAVNNPMVTENKPNGFADNNPNVNVNVNVNDNDNVNVNDNVKDTPSAPAQKKHKFGEYENVLLTDSQYNNLLTQNGETKAKAAIEKLSVYKKSTGKTYKDDAAAIRSWVLKALEEDAVRTHKSSVRPAEDSTGLEAYNWEIDK